MIYLTNVQSMKGNFYFIFIEPDITHAKKGYLFIGTSTTILKH